MIRNESSLSLNSGQHSADGSPSQALKKGPWTAAEDAMLVEYVKKHGEGNWNSVQKKSGLSRCGKSCRLRWANHLRPNLKKGSFTPEEEMLILHLHSQLGNKWARMAAQLPGRTDNEIKNYWNTRIKRRQRAGLPLYPTEVQMQQQQHRRMGSLRPQPIIVPPSPAHSAPNSPLSHSPLHLFNQSFSVLMPMSNSMPEMPRVKRIRDEGLTFQFPLSPTTTTAVSPHMNQAGTTAGMMGMFQYGYGNQSSYNEISYGLKTELPSNQFFNGVRGDGGGSSSESGCGCGLLDAMLQEDPHGVSDGQRDMVFSDPFCGNGDQRKDLFLHSQCNKGMNRKREREEEMNPATTQVQDDISKQFDMISTPATTVTIPEASECFNIHTCDMSNSNGGQTSMVTDDELGFELQHLVSSLSVAPVDQELNIGSCPWNNMPGIC